MTKIYSGDCCLCDVGIPTGEKCMNGNDLYSGDIVQLWTSTFLGTDMESWYPSSGLTAIVGNQYQSFFGGTTKLINSKPELFTMGIISEGVQGNEFKVSLVKSHSDIIIGERFPSFGINYR